MNMKDRWNSFYSGGCQVYADGWKRCNKKATMRTLKVSWALHGRRIYSAMMCEECYKNAQVREIENRLDGKYA